MNMRLPGHQVSNGYSKEKKNQQPAGNRKLILWSSSQQFSHCTDLTIWLSLEQVVLAYYKV